jgi:hypothetical protein
MSERNGKTEIADWKLERFILDELDESEMDEIRRAAEADENLRARLDAIQRSNREILDRYPAAAMSNQIRGRLERATRSNGSRPGRTLRFALVPAALVAVIVFAVFVLPHLMWDDGTRLKGPSEQLRLHRKTAAGSEELHSGAHAREHDLVLLQYRTDEHAYGTILSVDGWGKITMHLPASGDRAAELVVGRSNLLGYAYELDAAPRWEVFFFVTSASPFATDRVIRAVEETLSSSPRDSVSGAYTIPPPSLDLPDDFGVSRFTLIKDSPHED